MWNSPTEAEKPPPKWVRPFFDRDIVKLTYRGYDDLLFWRRRCETHLRLKNHRQNESRPFFDGENVKLTYRGYDDLLFWRGQCKSRLPRLWRPSFLMGTMWNPPAEAERPPPTELSSRDQNTMPVENDVDLTKKYKTGSNILISSDSIFVKFATRMYFCGKIVRYIFLKWYHVLLKIVIFLRDK